MFGANLSYLWSPSDYLNDPQILEPITKPIDDVTYRMGVTGIGNCTVYDTIFIKVLKQPRVANAFTPNGDGVNDTWMIRYLEGYEGATVQVYNRYGQEVFRSEGYDRAWDGKLQGKPLPVGTYYYIVNPKNRRPIITGSVTIIR